VRTLKTHDVLQFVVRIQAFLRTLEMREWIVLHRVEID
jgi:hypothetical protein